MLVCCRSYGEIPATAVHLSEVDPLELPLHMNALFTVEIELGLLRVPTTLYFILPYTRSLNLRIISKMYKRNEVRDCHGKKLHSVRRKFFSPTKWT